MNHSGKPKHQTVRQSHIYHVIMIWIVNESCKDDPTCSIIVLVSLGSALKGILYIYIYYISMTII